MQMVFLVGFLFAIAGIIATVSGPRPPVGTVGTTAGVFYGTALLIVVASVRWIRAFNALVRRDKAHAKALDEGSSRR